MNTTARTPGVQRFNYGLWMSIFGGLALLLAAIVADMSIVGQTYAYGNMVWQGAKDNVQIGSEACAVNSGDNKPLGITLDGKKALCAWGGTKPLN